MAILPLIIFFAVFRMTKDKEPFVPLQYTISYFEDKVATTAMAAALTMRSPALAGGVAGRCLFLDVTMGGMAVGNYIIFAGG